MRSSIALAAAILVLPIALQAQKPRKRELNLPIRYIGVGEQAGDLLPFEPDKFIASLFS